MTIREELKQQITSTSELLEDFEEYINSNFKITTNDELGKKSLKAIRKFFLINIPDDINFLILVELAREVALKFQRATYIKDKQRVKLDLLLQTRQDKYNIAYQNARSKAFETTKKTLSAESCKVEALIKVKSLDDTLNTQQVICNFWDSTCKTLVEVRKLIEVMSIALSGDAKIQRDFIVKEGK